MSPEEPRIVRGMGNGASHDRVEVGQESDLPLGAHFHVVRRQTRNPA